MANDAHLLAARQGLIDRIHAVELRLARTAQAATALEVLREHLHGLGNAIQIVDLTSQQLAKQVHDDPHGFMTDLRTAAADAHDRLTKMIALAHPPVRELAGAPFAPTVRAALDVARPALRHEIDLRDELLASDVACRLDADELEVLAIATLLEADTSPTLELVLRERTVDGKRWCELIRCDTRPGEQSLDSPLLATVGALAHLGAGEVSLAPGRKGHELVIALPTARS